MLRHWLILLTPFILIVSPALAQDDTDLQHDFDDTPAEILLELEKAGVFPAGGELALVDDTRRELRSSQFINLDTESDQPNFVFGGKLLFEPWDENPDDVQACALVARANVESETIESETERIETAQINTFVDIGVTNMDEVYVADRFGTADDDVTVEKFETDLAYKAPIEIIAVVLDNTLTVYVQSERIVDAIEIQAPTGAFAFALVSTHLQTNCVGFDFWAYTLEENYVREGCEITTASTINQRAGAGTNFDVLSQLGAGQVAIATGQTIDGEGFTWWRLENDLWMREDVVIERGYCRTLTQIPTQQ